MWCPLHLPTSWVIYRGVTGLLCHLSIKPLRDQRPGVKGQPSSRSQQDSTQPWSLFWAKAGACCPFPPSASWKLEAVGAKASWSSVSLAPTPLQTGLPRDQASLGFCSFLPPPSLPVPSWGSYLSPCVSPFIREIYFYIFFCCWRRENKGHFASSGGRRDPGPLTIAHFGQKP